MTSEFEDQRTKRLDKEFIEWVKMPINMAMAKDEMKKFFEGDISDRDLV